MSQYTSREIAAKLYRYASLLKAEALKQSAIEELTGGETVNALDHEAEEAQTMANYLHEIKERI
jgi:hypothetical protein